jgi:hypothetical protein
MIYFGIITRQAIRRGSFDSVRELTAAIGPIHRRWNDCWQPFTWTKPAGEIRAHTIRKEPSPNATIDRGGLMTGRSAVKDEPAAEGRCT